MAEIYKGTISLVISSIFKSIPLLPVGQVIMLYVIEMLI